MPNVLPRSEAIRLCLTTYFTGKPCVHGHIAPRRVNNRRCMVCTLASHRAYKLETRDHQLTQTNSYHLENRERRLIQMRTQHIKRRTAAL